MCTGMKFCAACEDPAVAAWAAGETHETPMFGDGAQRFTAQCRRYDVIEELMLKQDLRVLDFPETGHYLPWITGLSHEEPWFRGTVHQSFLTWRRNVHLRHRLEREDPAVLDFPEFNEFRREYERKTADRARDWKLFKGAQEQLPAFAAFARRNLTGSRSNTRQRKKGRRIAALSFIRQSSENHRKFLEAIGADVPWWLKIEKTTPETETVVHEELVAA